MMNNDYEVVEFKNGEFKLDVSVTPDSDTVWLTIDQMVDLFQKNKSTISRHIAKDRELETLSMLEDVLHKSEASFFCTQNHKKEKGIEYEH